MLMLIMGLHICGSAFVPPDMELRKAFTLNVARRAAALRPGGALR